MQENKWIKIASLILALALLASLTLSAAKIIPASAFWIIAAVSAIAAYWLLPKFKIR